MSATFSDIAEDSEPEREAHRVVAKELRRKRKRPSVLAGTQQAISIHQSDSELDNMQSVLELSSDIVEIVHSPRPIVKTVPPASTKAVLDVEISCTDEDIPSRILPRKPRIVSTPSTTQSIKSHTIQSTTTTTDEKNDQESTESPLFQKYALNAPKSRSASIQPVAVAPQAPRVRRKVSNKFEDEFTSMELDLVRVCPGCDVPWSMRKTGAHKLIHIRTCAKKQSLADDTIRTIMRRMIAEAKGSADEENTLEVRPNPKTVDEELVPEQGGHKQRKKTKPLDTVKKAPEARSAILERARSVLGEVPRDTGEGSHTLVRTQAVASGALPSIMFEQTQVFGQSKLADQNRPSTSLFQDEESIDFMDDPTTQAFTPSRLGGTSPIVEGTSSNDPSTSSLPLIDLTKCREKGALLEMLTAAGSSNALSTPNDHTLKPLKDDIVQLCNDEDDDVAICCKPDSAPPSLPKSKTKTKKSTSTTRSRSPKTSSKKPKSTRKAKLSGYVEKKDAEEVETVNFEQVVLERIKADRELHLRILRHEPIHFDVFTDLAEIEGTRKGLRQRLRNYLDVLGVSFYGSDGAPTSRGRR